MDAPVVGALEKCPACHVEAKGQANSIVVFAEEPVGWMAVTTAVDVTDQAGKKCGATTVMARASILAADVVDLGMNNRVKHTREEV